MQKLKIDYKKFWSSKMKAIKSILSGVSSEVSLGVELLLQI